MKQLPNILSFSRIVLAVLFFPFRDNIVILLALYFLAGVTDILDGYFARKFNTQSLFGSKLDTVADFVFWVGVFVVLLFKTELFITPIFVFLFILMLLLRGINVLITVCKFKQVGMLHSTSNRVSGILLYLCTAVFLFNPTASLLWWVPVLILVAVSSIEETYILYKSDTWHPNQKYFADTPNQLM